MTTTKTWHSRTTVRAIPEHVIETLTDPAACARWSPIPFSLDNGDSARLRPGTTTQVSGRLLGAKIRFNLHTLAADPGRLQLHARGPIDILVDYTLKPIRDGCALDALISIHPPNSRFGQLLARATGLLLATGALDHAVNRIAHEAETRGRHRSRPPAGGPERATRRDRRRAQAPPPNVTLSTTTCTRGCGRVR
jgi:hypothetical protein